LTQKQANASLASKLLMPLSMQSTNDCKPPVHIVDTTLREGAQAAYVYFDESTQITIARELDRVGVREVEVPWTPEQNSSLRDAIQARTGLSISLWVRAVHEDIVRALACEPTTLSVALPVSDLHIEKRLCKDRFWVLRQVEAIAEHSKTLRAPIEPFCASSRARPNAPESTPFASQTPWESARHTRWASWYAYVEASFRAQSAFMHTMILVWRPRTASRRSNKVPAPSMQRCLASAIARASRGSKNWSGISHSRKAIAGFSPST
jgi:hypothetical protein